MYTFITVIKIFPFIAGGLIAVLLQIGVHFRRRRDKTQWVFFSPAGFLALLILLWLVFRGDLHASTWAKSLWGAH